MESANRVLTRRALDMLKTIATGQFKTAEEAKEDMISEGGPVITEEQAVETEAGTGDALSVSKGSENETDS
jgi:hypothetical protein